MQKNMASGVLPSPPVAAAIFPPIPSHITHFRNQVRTPTFMDLLKQEKDLFDRDIEIEKLQHDEHLAQLKAEQWKEETESNLLDIKLRKLKTELAESQKFEHEKVRELKQETSQQRKLNKRLRETRNKEKEKLNIARRFYSSLNEGKNTAHSTPERSNTRDSDYDTTGTSSVLLFAEERHPPRSNY